jgi:hypothetical protein
MGWTRRAPAPPSRKGGTGLPTRGTSHATQDHQPEAVPTIGIEIGKTTFHLIGLDKMGAIVLRQKLSRNQVDTRLANVPRCLIGTEACVGAHHLVGNSRRSATMRG